MKRLDLIDEWIELARRHSYDAHQLARHCEVTPRHLRRHFQARFHRSTQDWLDELRLWDAALLLCQGYRVKRVAFDLKFPSCPQFCHQFKRFHGYTPTEFVLAHYQWTKRRKRELSRWFEAESIPSDLFELPWQLAWKGLKPCAPDSAKCPPESINVREDQ